MSAGTDERIVVFLEKSILKAREAQLRLQVISAEGITPNSESAEFFVEMAAESIRALEWWFSEYRKAIGK